MGCPPQNQYCTVEPVVGEKLDWRKPGLGCDSGIDRGTCTGLARTVRNEQTGYLILTMTTPAKGCAVGLSDKLPDEWHTVMTWRDVLRFVPNFYSKLYFYDEKAILPSYSPVMVICTSEAAASDRGRMEQRNGFTFLRSNINQLLFRLWVHGATHDTIPDKYFSSGGPSSVGEMSNAASIPAIVIHKVAWAKKRPGHRRAPKPNAVFG